MSDMKLIMENWRGFSNNDLNKYARNQNVINTKSMCTQYEHDMISTGACNQ